MATLIDMGQVILGWTIAFVAIAGWGHLVHRLCGPFSLDLELWFEHFWLGIVAVLAFLQIWNLFLPVDWKVSLVVTLVGFAATFRQGFSAFALSRSQMLALLLCVPVLIRFAHQSLLPPSHSDSGLYHFNMIRWHMEYALPPGLGNLHGRLAFNISYFLYVAMLNVYPWFQHGYNIANSLWAAVFTLQVGQWTCRLLLDPGQPAPAMLMRLCVLPVMFCTIGFSPLSNITYHTLASPSPDVPLLIWGILLFLKFVDYLFPRQVDNLDNYSPILICSMAACAITLKISMAALAASIMAITLSVWLRRSAARQMVATLAALFLLLLLPWSVRGVVMSGYPSYPSTAGAMAVDWRVPKERVAAMARVISVWAKGEKMKPRPNWLQFWTHKYLRHPIVKWPLIAFGTGSVTLLILAIRSRFDAKLLIPVIPPLLAVAYWFTVAPNVRFVGSSLWLLGLWPAALGLGLLLKPVQFPWRQRVLIVLLIIALWWSLPPLFVRSPHFRHKVRGFQPIPSFPLEIYRTPSGLEIWVPTTNNNPWDAPLPAVRRPYKTDLHMLDDLQLRGASLAQGFRPAHKESVAGKSAPGAGLQPESEGDVRER